MTPRTIDELTAQTCEPCEGGVEPYSADAAREQLESLSGWSLAEDGKKIQKQWDTGDFRSGMSFLDDVAELAEKDGHHPDLHLEGYKNARIELSTHAIGGLSENDFILAAKIDRAAKTLG